MNRTRIAIVAVMLIVFSVPPVFAEDDPAKRMSDILMAAKENGNYQVSADEVNMWIRTKADDFIVLDVRPNPEEYKAGHIPGSVHIPFYAVLLPENMKKLPKDKKIILVCGTGQLENMPVVPLRMLGYDAYTMTFGYAAWIKGFIGGQAMKSIVGKAASRNYPVER
ncbi:MAG: rhodanese-like domain-containing protein [Alphaproteobacteria bacterium]|uniref:Rhodanese-like domain-containing protein n=1 Tax=Candidatus Nitrobium versatile TaxID=2884831 RepID=A0A953M0K4_9BACT|nr:rhodanese-like domain-containing protein [Candidatus Nitrobium versatile]